MNIYDIAKEAGVSISTVSRVLNKKENVNEETRCKVEEILKKYDYVPSGIARGMVSKSMKTVAILTVDVRVPQYARIAYTIEREFSKRGYNVQLCNTGGDLEEAVQYLDVVTSKQVDGVVLVGSIFNRIELDERVASLLKHTPVVVANGQLNLPGCYSVLVDDRLGISLAVDHLYQKGHREIFYLKDMDTDSAQRKQAGFLETMKRLGLDGASHIRETEFGLQGGMQAVQRLLDSEVEVSAIVCGEDLTAVGVLKGLKCAGIKVPEEIAVTGFNHSDYAKVCEPELTTVDNKAELVGGLSVQLLETLIRKGEHYASMVVQPQLVLGRSS